MQLTSWLQFEAVPIRGVVSIQGNTVQYVDYYNHRDELFDQLNGLIN